MITCNYVPDPPRVTLDVTSMPAGTARVEVVRIDSNGSQAPVRGAADVPVQDAAAWTATDWDVPVGRAPVWRATYRNAAGGLLGTETGQLDSPVPAPDCDLAWISNPYDPSSAMLVTLMAGTDDETGHDMEASLSLPGRRTHLPSAVVGVRGIGGSRTLVVRCWTLEEAQQLEDLLATTTTLLVRSPAIRHRTGCLYVVIGEAREMSHHNRPATPEATTWTLSADEVDPGQLGILVPPWTYADLAAYLQAQTGTTSPTYSDLRSVFPLYLDVTKGV